MLGLAFGVLSSPFTEYDLLGRQAPTRLKLEHYLLAIAQGHPERVRRVPGAAIVDDGHDDEGLYAFVKCPCGAQPTVRRSLGKCVCERYYAVFDGRAVFVVYGEMEPPPLQQT